MDDKSGRLEWIAVVMISIAVGVFSISMFRITGALLDRMAMELVKREIAVQRVEIQQIIPIMQKQERALIERTKNLDEEVRRRVRDLLEFEKKETEE